MSIIGTFYKNGDSFIGEIHTLQIDTPAVIRPIPEKAGQEKGPHYRVFNGAAEIGVAWLRQTADEEREYLSVMIDDPSLTAPIHANFVPGGQEPGSYQLIWSRK
ncbi:MAG: DUF736 domain-containing protein [Clostridiaceae bacterium]|nr:DUF736 domain-containing protein [Clostridiaceae bacterium]